MVEATALRIIRDMERVAPLALLKRFQEPVHLVALAPGGTMVEQTILAGLPEGSQLSAVDTSWDQPRRDLDRLDGGQMPRVFTLLDLGLATEPEDAITMAVPLLRPEDALLISSHLVPAKPLNAYGLQMHETLSLDDIGEDVWLTTSNLASYSRYHEIRLAFMHPIRKTREIVSLRPQPVSDRELLYPFDVDGQEHRFHVRFPIPIRSGLLEDPLHIMGFACSEAWKIAECIHPEVIRFPWLGGDERLQSFLAKETEYYLQQALYLKHLGWDALPKIVLEGDITHPVVTHVEDKYLMSISGGKESTFALEWLLRAGLPTEAFTLHYDGGPYSGWAGKFPYFHDVRTKVTFHETQMWSDRDPGDLFAFAGMRNDPAITSALCAMGLIAGTYGFRFLVMSNDQSANEAQAQMDGKAVNHQSAKGSAYIEHINQHYTDMGLPYRYVTMCEQIYSLGAVFGLKQFCGPHIMTQLASCNEVQWIASDSLWCGTCPKCCFSIALIEAATSRETALCATHGRDLLLDGNLNSTWDSLWDPKAQKAFECVGEKAETWHALWLCKQSRMKRGEPLGYLKRIGDPGPIGDYLCLMPPSNIPTPHQEALCQVLSRHDIRDARFSPQMRSELC